MRDIGTDDPRVRVRPGKGSRPRTKIRPDYSTARRGRVFRIDRGRYQVTMVDDGTSVVAVKARELPHGAIVVGDLVAVVGDLSGRKDTLARIVAVDERTSTLRRTAEESEAAGVERVLVANADLLLIVSAAANPEPRPGMIDRCLVAAYDAGMTPILVITKTDLARPDELLELYAPLQLEIVQTAIPPASSSAAASGLSELQQKLAGQVAVLIGHSGVGKSTLLNALVPQAQRETGAVNEVTGRGRHTSTSTMAFATDDAVIIDTPGIRTFGLAYVSADDLLRGFPDLAELTQDCPRGCTHLAAEPECALDTAVEPHLVRRVESFRRLLATKNSAY
ncbi:MAG: ribosome small subunit-dependent GTPase A [Trueperella sp.]|nr:ribosome small subunit-dependent GTPase A [Trueperella sp.]